MPYTPAYVVVYIYKEFKYKLKHDYLFLFFNNDIIFITPNVTQITIK